MKAKWRDKPAVLIHLKFLSWSFEMNYLSRTDPSKMETNVDEFLEKAQMNTQLPITKANMFERHLYNFALLK